MSLDTYDSISKFSAWVKTEDGEEVRFVFTREGITWKLRNILIPTVLFDSESPVARMSEPTQKPGGKEVEPKQSETFEVSLRDKSYQEADYMAGIQEEIIIAITFSNITGKDVRAFDGVLKFTDLLDNEILSARIAINERVSADTEMNWNGSLEYNQFMDSHRQFRGAKLENINVSFKTRKVLFSDGTTKEFQ